MDKRFVLARSLAAIYLLERGGSAKVGELLEYLRTEFGSPLNEVDVLEILEGLVVVSNGELTLNESGRTFAVLMAPWFVRKLFQLSRVNTSPAL